MVETRAVYDVRTGPHTLLEATRAALPSHEVILHTRSQVAGVTAQAHEEALINTLPDEANVLFVNGRFVADDGDALRQIQQATESEAPRAFVQDGTLVAAWLPNAADQLPGDVLSHSAVSTEVFSDLPITTLETARLLKRPSHLLDVLRPALSWGIAARTKGTSPTRPLPERSHATVHESVVSVNPEQIHLGSGARVRPGAILNAEDGPIYIGANAIVYEQAVIRGPCYLGPRCQAKIGANLEGTAAGPWCKLGGEIHDCIIQSYSNKGHAGFLGHTYLGSWCNLGADTNVSNLKNDYGEVTVYSPDTEAFMPTGRQFVGLFMGDHSKCGINTMFNTGTVIGTCCNLYGSDFPPRYVPPFSWGSPADGFSEYRLDKALEVAERVQGRRDTAFTDADRSLLTALFQQTQSERSRFSG